MVFSVDVFDWDDIRLSASADASDLRLRVAPPRIVVSSELGDFEFADRVTLMSPCGEDVGGWRYYGDSDYVITIWND